VSILDPLFGSAALDQVFSDAERVQAILHFEAALARAEAAVAIIPEANARSISAKCRVEYFNLNLIAQDAARAGNLAIPIVKHLTEAVAKDDKDAARFVHWGATSQDAVDTGVVLQLRRALELFDQDLGRLTGSLVSLVEQHRATPMVARTWLQQALPTTFGFVVAGWLDAILRHRVRLAEIRPRIFMLQFGGAVGTLAALGSNGPAVARALAHELKLDMPPVPWHAHRDRFAEFATTLGLCMGTLGKMARDISLHTQTEVAELFEPSGEGRGGSSTMPHKRNPVTCAVVLAAAQRVPGLVSTLLGAMVQEEERGLGGWHAEWETLPQLVCLVGGALHHLAEMLAGLEVDSARMRANLETTRGLIFAEAVSMALGDRMGKMPAHLLVEAACKKALAEKRHLKDVLLQEPGWHGHLTPADLESLFEVRNYLGSAEEFTARVLGEAANFAARR
jgi:3-carboxy-cis,cis-muconate cycloisomerase